MRRKIVFGYTNILVFFQLTRARIPLLYKSPQPPLFFHAFPTLTAPFLPPPLESFLRVTAGKPTPSLTGAGGPLCHITRTPITPTAFTLSTPSGSFFSSSASSVLGTSPTPSSALHFVEHPGPLPGTSLLEAQSQGYLCLDPASLTLTFNTSASHATPFTLSPVRAGAGAGAVRAPPKKSPSPLPPLSTLTAPTSVCLFYGQGGKTINVIGKGNRATGNGGGGPFATFLLHPTLSTFSPSPTSFTLQAHNGAHLAAVEDGKVSTTPTLTQALHLIPSAEGGEVTLQCSLGKGYLTVGAAPMLLLTLGPKENATLFKIGKSKMEYKEAVVAAAASAAATHLPSLPPPLPFTPSPTFLSDFKTQGYVIIPGAVPPMAVEAALRSINHTLGEAIMSTTTTTTSMPPPSTPLQDWKHSSHPTLTGLYACTRVKGGVEALLLEGTAPAVMKGCQVAPRFPKPLTPEQSFGVFTTSATLSTPTPPAGSSPSLLSQHLKEGRKQGDDGRWHVDGMDKGRAYPFSLLVGVFLNDTLEAGAGQFTVFPGSHLHLAKVMGEGGEGVMFGEDVKQSPSSLLLPPHCSKPLELMVKAGDAVLVHPLLAHRVGVNYSPHVRHACFFRVSAVGHEKARAGLVAGDPFGEIRAATAAV